MRVLIADAHPIVRSGLNRLFNAEPGLVVCCEAESADQAVVAAEKWQADLAVVDLSFGGRPTTDVVRLLRERRPTLRVLVFSAMEETLWAAKSLQAGACGYVMRRENLRTLLARVHQALRGETAVSEAVSSALLRELTWDRPTTRPTGEDSLGDRELQVLRLIGHGRGTKDIAADMHISVKTVDAHREHIKRKLGLGNGAELIRYAVLKVHREGDALGGE